MQKCRNLLKSPVVYVLRTLNELLHFKLTGYFFSGEVALQCFATLLQKLLHRHFKHANQTVCGIRYYLSRQAPLKAIFETRIKEVGDFEKMTLTVYLFVILR